MKRRDLLKSFLAAPFVGLFKGEKPGYSCSSSMSGHPSTTNSVEPKCEGTFVYKGHSFKWSQYKTDGCYLISLEENGDITAHMFDEYDFDNIVWKKWHCDSMIAKIESWKRKRPIYGDGIIKRV